MAWDDSIHHKCLSVLLLEYILEDSKYLCRADEESLWATDGRTSQQINCKCNNDTAVRPIGHALGKRYSVLS